MLGKLFKLGPGNGPSPESNGSSDPPPGHGPGPFSSRTTPHSAVASNGINIKSSPGLGHQPHPDNSLPRPVSSLESVQEDMYTRDLLFPNCSAGSFFSSSMLWDPPTVLLAAGNPFDFRHDLDLEPSHVRVLVLQDAISSTPPVTIFDSHPGPPDPVYSPTPFGGGSAAGFVSNLGSVPPFTSGSGSGSGSASLFSASSSVPVLIPDSTRTSSLRHARSSELVNAAVPFPPPPTASTLNLSRIPPVATATSHAAAATATAAIAAGAVPRRAKRPVRQSPDSPLPRQGAFDRRPSVQSRSQSETDAQRKYREHQEELKVFASCVFGNSELMAYKGTSTKVHVVPAPEPRHEQRSTSELSSSYVVHGDRRGSVGRSSLRTGRTPYPHSFSDMTSPLQAVISSGPSVSSRDSNRQRVIISRLFPVVLPTDDRESETAVAKHQSDDHPTGLPVAHIALPSDEPATVTAAKKKRSPLRQKRIQMYAVALVVQLPPTSSASTHLSTDKNIFRSGASFNDPDSFPSSYGSATGRHYWGAHESGSDPSPYSAADVEDRIDTLTLHWDIITRTLNYLQSRLTRLLIHKLRRATILSPDSISSLPSIPRAPSIGGGRRAALDEPTSTPKTLKISKLVRLPAGHLQHDRTVAHEVDVARTRIITGLAAARVVTGQGRWGIWRDEVRSLARLPGSRDHDFFVDVLNGFLATHTDWLQALCPALYRNRYALQQQRKPRTDDDLTLTSRTIIVTNDKMMARRLVFLLASFLPSSHPLHASAAATPTATPTITTAVRAHRTSTSSCLDPFSHSPPTHSIYASREESLRRKVNRRPVLRSGPSHSRNSSLGITRVPASPVSASVPAPDPGCCPGSTPSSAPFSTIVALPIQAARLNDMTDFPARTGHLAVLTPGSTAQPYATTAVAPETTVPHFSTTSGLSVWRDGSGRGRGRDVFASRPGSTGSVAAEDLKRTLRRGESSGSSMATVSHISTGSRNQQQRQGMGWSNVFSGLWNVKKQVSLATAVSQQQRNSYSRTDKEQDFASPTRAPLRSLSSRSPPPMTSTRTKRAKSLATNSASDSLTSIVTFTVRGGDGARGEDREAEVEVDLAANQRARVTLSPVRKDGNLIEPTTPRGDTDRQSQRAPPLNVDRTPDPLGDFISPVKTSINVEDGVIDVDVPLPDFITSFENPLSSPSSSGFSPTFGPNAGIDSFELLSRLAQDDDPPLNVGGWLPRFHPDFTLQAIPPQDGLIEAVKAAMRDEPWPSTSLSLPEESISSDQDSQRWINVSTTLVADEVAGIVTQIRYWRVARSRVETLSPLRPPYQVRQEPDSNIGQAVSAFVAQAGTNSELLPEEEFVEEQVLDLNLDQVLGAAIDRVMAAPAVPGEVGVPRDQCKTVVLSALESIVKSTIEDMERQIHTTTATNPTTPATSATTGDEEGVRNDGDGNDSGSGNGTGISSIPARQGGVRSVDRARQGAESVLRDTVRTWLHRLGVGAVEEG